MLINEYVKSKKVYDCTKTIVFLWFLCNSKNKSFPTFSLMTNQSTIFKK